MRSFLILLAVALLALLPGFRFPALAGSSTEFNLYAGLLAFFAALLLAARSASSLLLALAVGLVPLLVVHPVRTVSLLCLKPDLLVHYLFVALGAALCGWLIGRVLRPGWGWRLLIGLGVLLLAGLWSAVDLVWSARLVPLNPVLGHLLTGYGASRILPLPVEWSHRLFYLLLFTVPSLRPPSFQRAFLLVLFLGAAVFRDRTGWLPGRARLQAALPATLKTDLVTVRYPPSEISRERARIWADIAGFWLREDARTMRASPRPITVYLHSQKTRLQTTGTDLIFFAEVLRPAIHVTPFVALTTLHHEVAHAVTLRLCGTPPLHGAALPLMEGLAQALSKGYAQQAGLDTPLGEALRNGYLLSPLQMLNNFRFLLVGSGLSYEVLGSFVGYLLRNRLLSGEELLCNARWLSREGPSWEERWREYLAALPPPEQPPTETERLLQPKIQRSPLQRLCSRARQRILLRIQTWIRGGQYRKAERALRSLLRLEPGDPDWEAQFCALRLARGEIQQVFQEIQDPSFREKTWTARLKILHLTREYLEKQVLRGDLSRKEELLRLYETLAEASTSPLQRRLWEWRRLFLSSGDLTSWRTSLSPCRLGALEELRQAGAVFTALEEALWQWQCRPNEAPAPSWVERLLRMDPAALSPWRGWIFRRLLVYAQRALLQGNLSEARDFLRVAREIPGLRPAQRTQIEMLMTLVNGLSR